LLLLLLREPECTTAQLATAIASGTSRLRNVLVSRFGWFGTRCSRSRLFSVHVYGRMRSVGLPGVNVRVIDHGFVKKTGSVKVAVYFRFGTVPLEALHDGQLVAVLVAGVSSQSVVQRDGVDDERLSLPVPDRVTHVIGFSSACAGARDRPCRSRGRAPCIRT
jgi:hypothetical protein